MDQKNRYAEYALFAVIVFVTLFKINLIGNGFFALNDEYRYLQSGNAIKNLAAADLQSSANNLFSAKGRPGEIVVKIIPTTVQVVTAKLLGKDVYDPGNSFPLFLFNFLTYAGILFYMYRISYHLLKNKLFALLGLLVYSSLTNSHIYLRHALPYDTSLLLFLFVMYDIILHIERHGEQRANLTVNQHSGQNAGHPQDQPQEIAGLQSTLRLFLLGALGFFSYTIYPGYILLYLVIVFILFFYQFNFASIKPKILQVIYFGLGSASCLLLFEALSQFAGTSYIGSALYLSSTIKEGSFDETLVFLLRYVIQVEFLSGIMIMIGFILSCITIVKLLAKREYEKNSLAILLFLGLTSIYLMYAGSGYFFNKVVLYGRLIHQFIPFLCIFFAYSLHTLFANNTMKRSLVLLVSVVALVNFFVVFGNYMSVSYPRDMVSSLIHEYPTAKLDFTCEYENHFSYADRLSSSDVEKFESRDMSDSNPEKITMVNSCFMYPLDDLEKYVAYDPTPAQTLLRSEIHFMNFKAYQFEGYKPEERDLFDALNFRIDIYSEE